MEVLCRQAETVGQHAIAPADSQGGPIRAVGWLASTTGWAHTTGCIDLADYPLAHQGWIPGLVYDAHKLVAQHAPKAGISADDLKVCVADTGYDGPDPRLSWKGLGFDIILNQPDLRECLGPGADQDCSHKVSPSATVPIDRRPRFLQHDLFQA